MRPQWAYNTFADCWAKRMSRSAGGRAGQVYRRGAYMFPPFDLLSRVLTHFLFSP